MCFRCVWAEHQRKSARRETYLTSLTTTKSASSETSSTTPPQPATASLTLAQSASPSSLKRVPANTAASPSIVRPLGAPGLRNELPGRTPLSRDMTRFGPVASEGVRRKLERPRTLELALRSGFSFCLAYAGASGLRASLPSVIAKPRGLRRDSQSWRVTAGTRLAGASSSSSSFARSAGSAVEGWGSSVVTYGGQRGGVIV